MPFGLYDWKDDINKGMSRRDWMESTVKQFKTYIGKLIKAGKSFGGDEYVFGVIRIEEVYEQSLTDMPESDVVREGGREGESVRDFVWRQREYFKIDVADREKGVITIDWEKKRTVVVWEWVERW